MRCPFCGTDDTQVKDSRGSEDGASIRRRRLCSSCGSRFTTFERIQLRELIVVKRNGKKNIFDREKIVKSMEIALRKRKVDNHGNNSTGTGGGTSGNSDSRDLFNCCMLGLTIMM